MCIHTQNHNQPTNQPTTKQQVAVTFDIAGRRVIVEQDPNDPFATPSFLQPTTAATPASGFDPAVDVAHGLSEGAARRLGGRGEGEGLPVAASHGAAQLSGRAREVSSVVCLILFV